MITPPIQISSCVIDQDSALQDGQQLDFECAIQDSQMQWIKTHTLTDTGASATGFVSSNFVEKHHLLVVKLAQPCKLKLANDNLAPLVTHCAQVYFRFGDHYDKIWCFVTSLSKFDLILGMPWLEQHDPKLSLRRRTLTFDSEFCTSNCLLHSRVCTVNSCSSKKNGAKPDSFTRRPGDLPEEASDSHPLHQHQTILKRTNLDKSDLLPVQIILPPAPIWFDEEVGLGEYIAEVIPHSRIEKRKKDPVTGEKGCSMYRIKFTGRDECNANRDWQVWTDTAGCQDIVADFHHKNKEKPEPHRSFQAPKDWEPD